MTAGGAPRGVVCDDRPDMRRAVARLLEGCGYEVAGSAADLAGLRSLVSAGMADVAVLPLPVTGTSGLGAVRALHLDAPWCAVVVLSSFASLGSAAREAGAVALVADHDLVALRAVLTGLPVLSGVRGPQARLQV